MKRLLVLVLLTLAACKAQPTKLGTNLPSGNGQVTSAKSLSVVPASDAVFTVSGTIGGTTPDGGFATEGTLGNVKTDVDKIPSKGTATMSGSTPVTIATDDTMVKKLTQPNTTSTVTKSDSTDVSATCTKGLWVGTAGDVEVQYCNDSNDAGTAPILKNIPSGTFVPGCFKTIYSTGTTASNMVCFGP